MTRVFRAVIIVLLLFNTSSAEESPGDDYNRDDVSYSLGYQVGGDFKRQDLEIRPPMLLQGIKDALSGDSPLMNAQEMRKTLVDMQKTVAAAMEREKRDQDEKRLEEGREFLAANAKKEGVVTLASGLQYKVIKEGSGQSPKPGDTVTVHYRGTLIDGTEFDSSHRRGEPSTFRSDKVIKGWQEALTMMKPGSKWSLSVPPELAYGDKSPGRQIPANSTLIFEVELLSVKE